MPLDVAKALADEPGATKDMAIYNTAKKTKAVQKHLEEQQAAGQWRTHRLDLSQASLCFVWC